MRPRGLLRTRRRAARRLCAAGAGLAATLAVLPAATGILPVTRAVTARADETTISPASVSFGSVPVGKKVTTVVDISNTGNEPALVASATTLNAPFLNKLNVTPQMPINAGYDVKIPVSFVPARKGAFSAVYHLTWTDVTGSHTVSVTVSGVGK